MKKGYIKILYIGVLIIMVSVLTGCFKIKTKIEDLKSFHYSYSVGYYMNASISYDITKEKDSNVYLVKIKDAGMPEEEAREYTLKNEKIEEFVDLLNNTVIYKWNGFNKSDKNVMDGNSFSISINWGNQRNISAHGYMKYPTKYKEIRSKIESWFYDIDVNRPKENTQD